MKKTRGQQTGDNVVHTELFYDMHPSNFTTVYSTSFSLSPGAKADLHTAVLRRFPISQAAVKTQIK